MCRSIGWDHRRNCKLRGVTVNSSGVLNGISHMLEKLTTITSGASTVVPTSAELADISEATKKLWDLDTNRLSPNEDYILNVQRGHKIYDHRDTAPERLFSYVDLSVFERPTYKAFCALLDNYTASTGSLII